MTQDAAEPKPVACRGPRASARGRWRRSQAHPHEGPGEEEHDAGGETEGVVPHVAGLELAQLVASLADEGGHAVHGPVDDPLVEAGRAVGGGPAGTAHEGGDADTKLIVRFASVGQKKLVARFANLTPA